MNCSPIVKWIPGCLVRALNGGSAGAAFGCMVPNLAVQQAQRIEHAVVKVTLRRWGLGGLKSVLAPLVVIFAVTPLIVVVSLLVVALMMTPALGQALKNLP